MKHSLRPTMLSIFLSFLAYAAFAEGSAVDRLAWLSGCWSREGAGAGSGEQWMAPAGGTMLGVGRTVEAGKTVEYEFLQIRESPEGKLVYVALPSGQSEATFMLKSLSDSEVVFENLEHDFPQRVIYRRDGEARLVARIEGMRNGPLRGVDFHMSRSICTP